MKVESLIDCTHGHGIHLVMQTQHSEAIHWSSGETEIISVYFYAFLIFHKKIYHQWCQVAVANDYVIGDGK